MPPEDQENPTPADDERLVEDADPDAIEPGDAVEPGNAGVRTSFERMVSVLKKTVASRDEVSGWIAAWLPLIVALKSLASTATKLALRARQLVDRDSEEPIVDRELLDEISADFAELIDTFPEASALFFGVDDLDAVVRETLEDEDARAVVAGFGSVVEAKLNGLIVRMVEWALADGGPELSVERLEGFVRALEGLLQEVLERWVLPRVYEKFDE